MEAEGGVGGVGKMREVEQGTTEATERAEPIDPSFGSAARRVGTAIYMAGLPHVSLRIADTLRGGGVLTTEDSSVLLLVGSVAIAGLLVIRLGFAVTTDRMLRFFTDGIGSMLLGGLIAATLTDLSNSEWLSIWGICMAGIVVAYFLGLLGGYARVRDKSFLAALSVLLALAPGLLTGFICLIVMVVE